MMVSDTSWKYVYVSGPKLSEIISKINFSLIRRRNFHIGMNMNNLYALSLYH